MCKGWICTDPSRDPLSRKGACNAFCLVATILTCMEDNFELCFSCVGIVHNSWIPPWSVELPCCRLNLLDSDRNFVIRQLGNDRNTGLSVRIDFSHWSRDRQICSLGLRSNTTGGGDYRLDIECWENLIWGKSNLMAKQFVKYTEVLSWVEWGICSKLLRCTHRVQKKIQHTLRRLGAGKGTHCAHKVALHDGVWISNLKRERSRI